MLLTPTLGVPSDLLLKLEREAYRAFHASHPTHTADHLYNFCVTALAVRDWLFVQLAWSNNQKQSFYNMWRGQPLLDACADIANASKHCDLKKGASPHIAKASTQKVVEVYLDTSSNLHTVLNPEHPDISVALDSGRTVGVHEMTQEVLRFWRNFFKDKNIDIPSQDFETLSGLSD